MEYPYEYAKTKGQIKSVFLSENNEDDSITEKLPNDI